MLGSMEGRDIRRALLALLVIALLFAPACGKKGPPKLPSPQAKALVIVA